MLPLTLYRIVCIYKIGETMFSIEKQLIRLIEVTALSALMGETKNLDEKHKIRTKLKSYAFPEELTMEDLQ